MRPVSPRAQPQEPRLEGAATLCAFVVISERSVVVIVALIHWNRRLTAESGEASVSQLL